MTVDITPPTSLRRTASTAPRPTVTPGGRLPLGGTRPTANAHRSGPVGSRPTEATAPRLDWLTLADTFELACLVKCGPTAPAAVGPHRRPDTFRADCAEFNQASAAERMKQLLGRLDVRVAHEITTGGLRRRFQLHRLYIPRAEQLRYSTLITTGWRQGRREMLAQMTTGASAARRVWRPRLAAAAWRSALLAAGRHVRKHILGVRLTDQDLAAVLIRGAAVLDVPASLVPGGGCLVVSVADGPDRERILHQAALPTVLSIVS